MEKLKTDYISAIVPTNLHYEFNSLGIIFLMKK